MNKYTPGRVWTDSLRGLALGVSMVPLFLVPTTGHPNAFVKAQSVQQVIQRKVDVVTTIPDGNFDLRTISYSTPYGLESPALLGFVLSSTHKSAEENIPHILRDITDLPIETLASLAHVSRNAYYKWLDGKGISDEHKDRLNELLDLFQTLHGVRGSGIREFLETTGPAGKPIDLLMKGDSSAVIGLALRPPAAPVPLSNVPHTARQISGLSGWLRPTTRLDWGAPRLTSTEREEALDQLSPVPLFTRTELPGNRDEEEEDVFVAWGVVLE